MNTKENIRPGGRSARVQASVHKAVRALLETIDRAELTIPQIAGEAGVTPSTVYRRWGDLQELLGDVAVERLRPETDPADFGSGKADLLAWAEQYAEEMASGPGRQMIRDVMASKTDYGAGRCCGYTMQQLDVIVERAQERGETIPPTDTLIDHLVAPIMYRILFDDQSVTPDAVQTLVARLLPD
jgi:AcrR family transcriptional regulator